MEKQALIIKQTNVKAWWSNEGEDFPSFSFLNSSYLTSFVDSQYQINFINQFEAQVVVDSLLPVPGGFEVAIGSDIQYYFVKSIDKKMKNGTMVLNLVLDIYSSYAWKFLGYFSLTGSMLVKRTHKFNELFFEMEDELLNSIPKYYSDNQILEKQYPEYEGVEGSTKITIKNEDTTYNSYFVSNINANIYYVYGCGLDQKDTTTFTALPLMSINSTMPYIASSANPSKMLETIDFYGSAQEWQVIKAKITGWESQGYKDITLNILGGFNYPVNGTHFATTNYDYKKYDIKIDFRQEFSRRSDPNFLFWQNWSFTTNYITVNFNGLNYSDRYQQGVWKSSGSQSDFLPYPKNNYWNPENNRMMKIALYGSETDLTKYQVKNNKANLDAMINDASLINKFKGIYFLPNLANFEIIEPSTLTGKFNNYVAVEIPPDGIDAKNFTISNQISLNNKQENELKWNNPEMSSIVFLNYLEISYYENIKNWNFYYNYDNSELNLSGRFYFNGAGVLISNRGIDKLYNNVILFPYQLPSAVDQYTKYYSGIMDSINTGMEGQRASYELSKQQHLSNSITGAIGGAMSLAGNIAKGNIGGAIGAANGLAGGIANSVFDRKKMDLSNDMYYKQLSSKFSDVQRTQSASFNTSAVKDLTFLYSNFSLNNSEAIQMKSLTQDTIININNHIYLYGYQNIGWYRYDELFIYDIFNYVEFESNEVARFILNNMDSSLLSFKSRNIYKIVIDFWSQGRRIWSIKPSMRVNSLKSKTRKRIYGI